MNRIRLGAAALGVALAIVAIARDDRRIAWAAIVVLGIAVALRIAARRRAREHDEA